LRLYRLSLKMQAKNTPVRVFLDVPMPHPSRGHQRTILVVDDERPILALLSEYLASKGFQVLTAGLRDYQVQRRVVGGTWRSLGYRTGTSVTETLPRSRTYEYRIRARDRVGNRGAWVLVKVRV